MSTDELFGSLINESFMSQMSTIINTLTRIEKDLEIKLKKRQGKLEYELNEIHLINTQISHQQNCINILKNNTKKHVHILNDTNNELNELQKYTKIQEIYLDKLKEYGNQVINKEIIVVNNSKNKLLLLDTITNRIKHPKSYYFPVNLDDNEIMEYYLNDLSEINVNDFKNYVKGCKDRKIEIEKYQKELREFRETQKNAWKKFCEKKERIHKDQANISSKSLFELQEDLMCSYTQDLIDLHSFME